MARLDEEPGICPADPLRLDDFAEALDSLESANGERAGGPLPVIEAIVRALEEETAATPAEHAWQLRRHERAVGNEWTTEATVGLVGPRKDFGAITA
jgi:hypothetical protein